MSQYKITAIHKDVIVTDMSFDEIVTSAGIVLRSDDGKSHGVRPRWARVYATGPDQTDVKIGQWILIEHGRWTRKFKITTAEGEIEIQKVDVDAILAVSDSAPGTGEFLVGDSV